MTDALRLARGNPDGKAHVLAAVREVLKDGRARSVREIWEAAVAAGGLAKDSSSKYVYNTLIQAIGRQRLHGERPEFVHLPDGRFRLNVPQDPFAGHVDATVPNSALEAFIRSLGDAAKRKAKVGPTDGKDIGAPFERAVASAFEMLGFVSKRLGGYEQPDVVATAPLGKTAYTVAVECKSSDQGPVKMVSVSAPAEAARLCDSIGADFALLIGPSFEGVGALDAELATHGVALWLVDDLARLLRANDAHPVEWPDLASLFQPGRRGDDIFDFSFAHLHGAWKRAHVTLRYVLETGLAFQSQMVAEKPDSGIPDAPLTAEVLTELVNERLRAEHDFGRIGVEDVRQALQVASSPPVNAVRYTPEGEVTITRAVEIDPAV